MKTLDVSKIGSSNIDMRKKYETQNQKEFLNKNHDLFVKLTATENNQQNDMNDTNTNANQEKQVHSSDDSNLSLLLILKSEKLSCRF